MIKGVATAVACSKRVASPAKPSLVAGGVLILGGIFVPSATLVEFLTGTTGEIPNQLLLGATLFRVGLGILGLTAIVLGSIQAWPQAVPGGNPIDDANRKLSVAVLAVVLVGALALRLHRLDAGLWLDEIFTDVIFARASFGSIVTTFESENQHFLYSVLAHASYQAFGASAWALRLPAVLFGVGSIWALYLFAREVTNTKEAMLSAALLAFSYTHIWFSQNARGYSGLLFLTILSSWLFLRACREALPRMWLLYAMAVALGAYVHVTMAFVVLGQFLVYLWMLIPHRGLGGSNRWAGLFLGFGVGALLTFQLYALVLPQVLAGMGREESVVADWKNPLWTVLELARGMQISFAGTVVAIAALAIFSAGILSYARTNPVVIQLLVIPPVIGAALVIGMGHHLWPRFFFFAMGFGALIVMRGTMVFGLLMARGLRLGSTKSAWLGAGTSAALVLASMASVPAAYGPKQDYRGAADFVEASRAPGDAVAVAGLAVFPYESYLGKDWEYVDTLEDLNSVRSGAKRTWMIFTFPPVLEAVQPEIMASIKREFTVAERFDGTLAGGTIFVGWSESPAIETSSR